MTTDLSEAKQTLLRALEQIEEIEEELDGKVWALAVVYSVTRVDDGRTHEVGGWSATSEPSWATAAMLRRAADSIEDDPGDFDPEEDEGE